MFVGLLLDGPLKMDQSTLNKTNDEPHEGLARPLTQAISI